MGDPIVVLPEGATAFEAHVLSLLSSFERQPTLAYAAPSTTLPKTEAQEAIEAALFALARRALPSQQQIQVQPNTRVADSSALIKHKTPPPIDTAQCTVTCPSCGTSVQSPIVSVATPSTSFASLDISSSPRPVPNVAWINAHVNETGMSAEKELELLKAQVQDIARVCKAVATGDLTQKIIVPVKGQAMTELKDIINSMVDRLKTFATEVERVSLEVGTEGKLGGQAVVEGVEGTWRELTNVVNRLAANLTNQVRSIAKVTKAVARGDLSETITVVASGEIAELATTVNGMVMSLRLLAGEVSRVSLEVGSMGKLGGQAYVPDVEGVWKDLTVNVRCWLFLSQADAQVNRMCHSLTTQVREIARVTTAVARGDLSKTIEIEAEGEMAVLKDTVNSMVKQLTTFAGEVTRVALEVGTQGILGGQAIVDGVEGVWADLTTNVNVSFARVAKQARGVTDDQKMARNLTEQVREIAEVTKAVARGDLNKTVNADVQGEILDLKITVNDMVAQLTVFAAEVTRVSLEVGTEGKLGGQALVPNVEGTWKVLTDNVNLMALNLTTQVRSVADVTVAVAAGDLSKKISVEAFGEILQLKNTVNAMVDSLRSFSSEVTR